MTLSLSIVGPGGRLVAESGLDAVVARRREADFALGSEIVIRPRHAPLLMQTCACDVRWRRGASESSLAVGAGVLEVLGDDVTLVLTDGRSDDRAAVTP